MLREKLAILDKKEEMIIKFLAMKFNAVRFSEIQKKTELSSALLAYKLQKLIKIGLVKKITSGTYEIRYKTPLCYIYCDKPEYTYIGLLGLKQGRDLPEPLVALKLLEKEKIKPVKNYVLATKESISDWSGYLENFNIRTLKTEDTLNIEKIEKILENIILKERDKTVIILDCTSLTKTATIAFYKQAIKHHTPLIYIYEHTKTLIWLQSKTEITKNLNLTK